MSNPNANTNTGELLRQLSQVIIDRDAFIEKLAAERAAHDATKAELNGARAVIAELTRQVAHLESLYGWAMQIKSEHVRENE
jgi:hypothetical protein